MWKCKADRGVCIKQEQNYKMFKKLILMVFKPVAITVIILSILESTVVTCISNVYTPNKPTAPEYY